MLSTNQTFDPYALPPFANQVNKDLAQKIKEKEEKLTFIQFQVDDNTSRYSAMQNHIRSIKQEMGQTQALFEAKSRQLEAELNFKKLAKRQGARIESEIVDIEKEITELTSKMNTVQSSMYNGSEKIDQLRAEMNISKKELQDWLQLQTEKDADNAAIQKYSIEDEAKIKNLNLQLEKTSTLVLKLKASMDSEVTSTSIAQLELNQTTDQFKTIHQERQDLIDQWTQILAKIQKKDSTILESRDQLQDTLGSIRTKQSLIKEKQDFQDGQSLDNENREKEIEVLEKTLAKIRLEQGDESRALQELQDQLYNVRNEVYKSSSDLQNRKKEQSRMEQQLQEKLATLAETRQKLQETKKNLEQMESDKMSLEEKQKELEKIMKQQENRNKDLDKELKATTDQHFKTSHQLNQSKQLEKTLNSEISSMQANIRMLKSKINQIEQDILKQKSIIYAQDFQIEQLDRKVRRVQGERSDEEKVQLEEAIKALTEKFEHQTKMSQLLANQLKKSQDELRIANRKEDSLKKQKDQVLAGMNDVSLYLDGIQKQVSLQSKEKGEIMVEESLLKLEVRKLREILNSRADQVFNLESKKLELKMALEERNKEISIQRDLLRLEFKQAQEERVSAAAELRERVKKVENLKKRYEILMSQFSNPEADDGQEHTQAYFIIKAAQKKENLQKEGDELDLKIKKAELEVRELENTLKFMADYNDEYRAYLLKSELNSRDIQHKESLEQQFAMFMEKYRSKRHDYDLMHSQVEEIEKRLQMLTFRESNLLQAVSILEKKLHIMQTDVSEQSQKKMRALRSVIKLMKELAKDQEKSTEHQEMLVRLLKDQINVALNEISRIAEDHPEVAMVIHSLFEKYDLQVPSQPISRATSRPETVGDDFSSTSSYSQRSSRTGSRQLGSRGTLATRSVSLDAGSLIGSGASTPKGFKTPRSVLSSGRATPRQQ